MEEIQKMRKLCPALYDINDNYDDIIVNLCSTTNKYQLVESRYKLPIMMCMGAIVHSHYDNRQSICVNIYNLQNNNNEDNKD